MKLLVPESVRLEVEPLVPPGDDGILISYLWPKRVPAEELARYRIALNFHPAPLPEYRGFAPYTWGILNGEKRWGVTAHHMVAEIDAGPIVAEDRWPVNMAMETAESLREMAHTRLLMLLKRVIPNFWCGERGPERYYSRDLFERTRRWDGLDPETATRAFFCPPHPGWRQ